MDLKWFESKVGNKYLNEAAGLAAEKEAARKNTNKKEVDVAMTRAGCYALCNARALTVRLVCRSPPSAWRR